MAKNHHHHHHQQQQPLPRPTAPPTPAQGTPRVDAPVITSVALGRTQDGRHAVALLRTQGLVIVSCALLCQPTRDAATAEEAWRIASYPTLFHGNPPASIPGTLVSGAGLALDKVGNAYRVTLVEVENGKVLPFREPTSTAATHEERLGSFIYMGKKLDAWQELDLYAAKYLLRESLAERRRKAAGG